MNKCYICYSASHIQHKSHHKSRIHRKMTMYMYQIFGYCEKVHRLDGIYSMTKYLDCCSADCCQAKTG